MYTSKDDTDKLQRVQIKTQEQAEVLEVTESELIKKCNQDERKLATDFSTEAKELCRLKVNDEFPKFCGKLQSNRNKIKRLVIFELSKKEIQFGTKNI